MIQKLFIYLTLLLLIPDIYIFRVFVYKLTNSYLLRYLYFLPTLLLLAGLIYIVFFASSKMMQEKMEYIGWFMIVYMAFVFPKVIFFVCSLLDFPIKYIFKIQSHPFSWIGLVAAAICFFMILYGAIVGKTHFKIKKVDFYSSDLPESFNGYRILQLSDIHIGSWASNRKAQERVVNLINEQKPDLVVFTGDLVNNIATELNGTEELLSKIKARNGVYSVLGNHDYGPYYHWESKKEQAANLEDLKQRQAAMGWQLLNNSHVILYQEKDSIALIGVENQGEPPFSQHGDLKKAMQGTENIPFKILLSHNPTHWRREVLPETDIQLMLAGHTHAMQMALGHHSPSSFIYPEWGGMYSEGKQNLYVNVGLGFIGIPFRFGAWPEITLITLRTNQNTLRTGQK